MARTITVKVLPRSSKNEICEGSSHDLIKVRLTAAPVDDLANEKLIELLSREWRIPKTKIQILRGFRSRTKTILISN